MLNDILIGDALEKLKILPDECVNCCITSPPYYGLRDYGIAGQIGLEENPNNYVKKLVEVFTEVKRVLKKDGTLWLNLGDSYAGGGNGRGSKLTEKSKKQKTNRGAIGQVGEVMAMPKPKDFGLKRKDLIGIPWRVAFALQESGWYLRQDIIWHKPNPMPESVRDRCTKAHEYIFLLSKSEKYFFDNDAIREKFTTNNQGRSRGRSITPLTAMKKDRSNSGGFEKRHSGRNKRSVWSITPKPFKDAHFATFPIDLIEPCVLAGCQENGIVLDPFFGAGTTGLAAQKNNRNFIGIEINPQYAAMARRRLNIT